MTRTKQLQTWAEVRDFVFMQLDHENIRPGAESRLNDETWVMTMASEEPEDGLWIVQVEHQGNGTFVSLLGFRYFDDPDEDHWISLRMTPPVPAGEVKQVVDAANMMVHLGLVGQPSRELYRQVTEGTVPTSDAGPSPYL